MLPSTMKGPDTQGVEGAQAGPRHTGCRRGPGGASSSQVRIRSMLTCEVRVRVSLVRAMTSIRVDHGQDSAKLT